jgi:hypothetical protein
MLAALWLVVLGQPVFLLPFPQAPDTPATLAIAGSQVSLQRPCRSLQCLQAGWQLRPPPVMARRSPFAMPRALPARRYIGLRAPASRQDWIDAYGSNARLGARYGFEPIRDGGTQLRIELGSGYRLQPWADDGIGQIGPVARGSVQWLQQLGERTRLSQQLRVETGRGDTFVRNAMALDIALQPNWTLRSSFELRHDSAADDTATQGSVQLRYSF